MEGLKLASEGDLMCLKIRFLEFRITFLRVPELARVIMLPVFASGEFTGLLDIYLEDCMGMR